VRYHAVVDVEPGVSQRKPERKELMGIWTEYAIEQCSWCSDHSKWRRPEYQMQQKCNILKLFAVFSATARYFSVKLYTKWQLHIRHRSKIPLFEEYCFSDAVLLCFTNVFQHAEITRRWR